MERGFPNLCMCKNHLGGLLKQIAGLQYSTYSIVVKYTTSNCIVVISELKVDIFYFFLKKKTKKTRLLGPTLRDSDSIELR